ncbi:hypothetical protein MRX96_045190 [Rhipicephalus microplus]
MPIRQPGGKGEGVVVGGRGSQPSTFSGVVARRMCHSLDRKRRSDTPESDGERRKLSRSPNEMNYQTRIHGPLAPSRRRPCVSTLSAGPHPQSPRTTAPPLKPTT